MSFLDEIENSKGPSSNAAIITSNSSNPFDDKDSEVFDKLVILRITGH